MREFLTALLEDDPAAWRGDRMAERSDWILTLDAPAVAEIESAVSAVAARGVDLFDVTRDDFPLPNMGGHFETMLGALEGGRGFVLLRGLPAARWSEAGNRIALWGLGTHLGLPVGQDLAGNLLHDVRDVGRKFGSDDSIRYYQTSHAIRLHTDGGDVFALACVRQGAGGGKSLVVSAAEVFNEIVRRRPDLAVVLQEDFWMDARGQRPDGARCQVLPIYTWHDGLLSVLLKPEYVYSAQRFEDVPRLTEAQREALELSTTSRRKRAWHWSSAWSRETCCSRATTPSCTAAPNSRMPRTRHSAATCCGCGSRSPTGARCRPTTPTPGSMRRRTGSGCRPEASRCPGGVSPRSGHAGIAGLEFHALPQHHVPAIPA